MQEYIALLRRTRLFAGCGDEDILAMTACLGAYARRYRREEYVFRAGEHIRAVAVVAAGSLLIQKEDYWGNRSIVERAEAGEIFGEAYAMADSEPLLYDVVAAEDSTVLFLDVEKLMETCDRGCHFHARVIRNLLVSVSSRNRALAQKIGYMAQRTTREKLIAYLSAQSRRCGSAVFEIPFTREQLADYLAVDRSAMSRELCRMRDEGMLTFRRNRFELI